MDIIQSPKTLRLVLNSHIDVYKGFFNCSCLYREEWESLYLDCFISFGVFQKSRELINSFQENYRGDYCSKNTKEEGIEKGIQLMIEIDTELVGMVNAESNVSG